MHVTRLQLVMHWVEILAVFSFAISGLAEAKRRRLDAVGAFIVAFLTAFGGGTLRDLLLDRRPFYWIEHEQYLLALFVMSLFANWVIRLVSQLVSDRVLIVADAIGMGLFGVLGTQLALDAGVPVFVSVMMGVITAAFGGLLRDVVCNEVPMLLRDNHPYATCAFVGCFLYVGLTHTDLLPSVSVVIATLAIVIGRLATLRWNITLPR
ncbi:MULTISPECIES: trimeric intracellular cation channel family protein [Ralstonia]|uniref:Trimeric intracellular cation channel family protein n=1 Tax=Ralstonia chuxiongensis TaxID=2957504 RepID=A0AA41WRH0_9RALS|nr:trimeric intracellular cation channel family protein [Ralstonia chuxiongensis]MCP1173666.1 trimeric intracellular cation channel family protein [Ralstonia chuxiongensis]CAJ0770026.1 hypothetical protein R8510_00184 [Ralstonia chuxiongensis]